MPSGRRWAYAVIFWMSFSVPLVADDALRRAAGIEVRGGWKVIESENFRCWSQLTDDEARQLTESCERWRTRLRTQWIAEPEVANWQPKCDVVVHPHRGQYTRALNRPGDSSVGSTRMQFDQGRTVSRRIDVRADASDWSNAALPHELTHVVLGERFGGRALPRWADEGIAMLSESAEKQGERLSHLQTVLAGGRELTLSQVTNSIGTVSPAQRDAFYSQSLALTSLLIEKSSAAAFADFVDDAAAGDLEGALRRHYQLESAAALQQAWRHWTRDPQRVRFAALPIQLPGDVNLSQSAR